MDQTIAQLKATTFGGRKFSRYQLVEIQKITTLFSNLSRRELAHTICEQYSWKTPSGTDRIQTCLNALEEMESLGIIKLPTKMMTRPGRQKDIVWTEVSNEQPPIESSLRDLMPIDLVLVTEREQISQWNEFVDRYHYLKYRRPIGNYLRYYVIDRQGRKLGCLLFSFATRNLDCRDTWIGWTEKHRQKRLNLVINNNRFLIFPWVKVEHLASKVLAYAMRRVADDWASQHGFAPVLVETFVDPTKYEGTCYKASNWYHIGQTSGKSSKKNEEVHSKKDVYIFPLHPDAREILTDNRCPMPQKIAPYKAARISPENQDVYLWQKIITVVTSVSEAFDKVWQQRKRTLNTLLVVLFIFRLVFSKNKQGYGLTVAELWEYCRKLHIPLPQEHPVAPAAFCGARRKIDEAIFKRLNTEIIKTYEMDNENYWWKNHRLFAIDGSKINLPKELLKDGYQKQEHAHHPQGLASCLYQLKSKIPYDFDLVAHGDERLIALEHIQCLHENDLVVYDRGYFSYALLYAHHQKNIHAVFRLASNSCKIVSQFMQGDELDRIVRILPCKKEQKAILKKFPMTKLEPLQLRLLKYTIDNQIYTLGVTLFDESLYQRQELAELYHSRWGIEELYKVSKVLIDVEDFHSKTARGVKQELFAHFVMITLSRIFANQSDDVLLLEKGTRKSKQTIKTNFKNCLCVLARNLEELFLRQISYVKDSINRIYETLSACCQIVRPNRSYKRVSNKIAKKWRPSRKKNNKANVVAVA